MLCYMELSGAFRVTPPTDSPDILELFLRFRGVVFIGMVLPEPYDVDTMIGHE